MVEPGQVHMSAPGTASYVCAFHLIRVMLLFYMLSSERYTRLHTPKDCWQCPFQVRAGEYSPKGEHGEHLVGT